MYRRLLLIFLILVSIFSYSFAAEDEISQENTIKYNKVAYNTYLVLIGLFVVGLAITLLLIQSNYGHKHMFQIIGFVLFVLLLFWLFRFADF